MLLVLLVVVVVAAAAAAAAAAVAAAAELVAAVVVVAAAAVDGLHAAHQEFAAALSPGEKELPSRPCSLPRHGLNDGAAG